MIPGRFEVRSYHEDTTGIRDVTRQYGGRARTRLPSLGHWSTSSGCFCEYDGCHLTSTNARRCSTSLSLSSTDTGTGSSILHGVLPAGEQPRQRRQTSNTSCSTMSMSASPPLPPMTAAVVSRPSLPGVAYCPLDVGSWSEPAATEVDQLCYRDALRYRSNTWYRGLERQVQMKMYVEQASYRRGYSAVVPRPCVATSMQRLASDDHLTDVDICGSSTFPKDQEMPLCLSMKRRRLAAAATTTASSLCSEMAQANQGSHPQCGNNSALLSMKRAKTLDDEERPAAGGSILKSVLLGAKTTAARDYSIGKISNAFDVRSRETSLGDDAVTVDVPEIRPSMMPPSSFSRCSTSAAAAVIMSTRRDAGGAFGFRRLASNASGQIQFSRQLNTVAVGRQPSDMADNDCRYSMSSPTHADDASVDQANDQPMFLHESRATSDSSADFAGNRCRRQTSLDERHRRAEILARTKTSLWLRRSTFAGRGCLSSPDSSLSIIYEQPMRCVIGGNSERTVDVTSTDEERVDGKTAVQSASPACAAVTISAADRDYVSGRVDEWLDEIATLAISYRQFAGLSNADHAILIERARCRLLLLYMAESVDFWFRIEVARDELAGSGNATPIVSSVSDRMAKAKATTEAVHDIQRFIERCRSMKINSKEYHCMRLIALFHSGICGLERPDLVRRLNASASRLLCKMSQEAVVSETDARRRYAELLLRIRTLYGVDGRAIQALFLNAVATRSE